MWMAAAGGCIAAAAAGLLRSEYEKKHFKAETYTIESEKLERPERTLVFLSDLHDNEFGHKNERLLRAIGRIHPSAVLIGGDMMVCKGKASLEVSLDLIRRLVSRYPVYYGNGNHETRMDERRDIYGDQYDIYTRELKKLGAVLLRDSSADLGEDIRITGINLGDDYYQKFHYKKLTSGEIRRKAGKADRERFQILLAHPPMFFQGYRRWGADLSLSGHFHGGTIRLPLLGGVMTPQLQFFYPWCGGLFQEEGKYLLVSRGLGTHSVNIRFNNRPHLVVIRLKSKGMGT